MRLAAAQQASRRSATIIRKSGVGGKMVRPTRGPPYPFPIAVAGGPSFRNRVVKKQAEPPGGVEAPRNDEQLKKGMDSYNGNILAPENAVSAEKRAFGNTA